MSHPTQLWTDIAQAAPPQPASRRRFLALTTATGGLLAGACEVLPGRDAASVKPADTSPFTMEIWVPPYDPEYQRHWDTVTVPKFKEKYPQASFEYSWVGWAEAEQKLIVARVSGVMPQMFRVGASSAPSAADQHLAAPLDDRIRRWGQRNDFFDGSWNTVVWRGKVWGLPQLTANRLWCCRKDLADEMGITVGDNWTWEQQLSIARQATRGDATQVQRLGAFPIDLNDHEYQALLLAAGGRYTRGGKPVFNGPEGQWALQLQIDRRNAILPPGRQMPPNPGSGASHLSAGSAFMQYGNMNGIANPFRRAAPDKLPFLTVPMPPVKVKRVSASNTDWVAIGQEIKQPDAAWELLRLSMEPEDLIVYNEEKLFLPPRKSAAQKAAYMQQPFMKRAGEALDKYGVPFTLLPSRARLAAILQDEMRAAFNGQKSVKQALDDAARLWIPILEEAKWDD